MAQQKTANPNDFILPDLGEGVHEAELIAWRVQVGQRVAEHDILAEMETDKALVEVPSPRAGVIAALHGKPGDILRVGQPLVSYVPEGEAREKPAEKATAPVPPQPTEARQPDGQASASGEEARADAGTVVGVMPAETTQVLATPAVRRLARDLGVDINTVRGTGIGGRVTERDVRAAAAARTAETERVSHTQTAAAESQAVTPTRRRGLEPTPSQPVAPSRTATETTSRPVQPTPAHAPPGGEPVRVPFRGVRRTIASRLRESMDRAVHFNVMDEADVTALDDLRRKLGAAGGEKISFLPFVASALCRVLLEPRFRALNATVDEKPDDPAYEPAIVQHRAVHLGIATDTDSGLMVPVIRDCDALGVLEIARRVAELAAACRNRTIAREHLVGSTFTISNVGSLAGRFATPVINYPEVGILGVGRAREQPIVRRTPQGHAVGVGLVLPLSLACDHRAVDGATAALALARLIELLENPEDLLTPARG